MLIHVGWDCGAELKVEEAAGNDTASKLTHSDNVTTVTNYRACIPYIVEVIAFINCRFSNGGKQKQCEMCEGFHHEGLENSNSVWTNQNLVVQEERRNSV